MVTRDRIQVLQETTERNTEFSSSNKSYTHGFHTRAEVSFKSAKEGNIEGMQRSEAAVDFKVRYRRSTYTDRQVVVWQNGYYQVLGIKPDRHRRWMILSTDQIPKGTINII